MNNIFNILLLLFRPSSRVDTSAVTDIAVTPASCQLFNVIVQRNTFEGIWQRPIDALLDY